MKAIQDEDMDEALSSFLEAMIRLERRHEDQFGADWKAIFVLQQLRKKGPMSVGEIAAKLGVKAFTASRMVTKLVDEGLMKRDRDDGDGRVVLVSVTKAGLAKLGTVDRDNRKVVSSAFESAGGKELESFISALKSLNSPLSA